MVDISHCADIDRNISRDYPVYDRHEARVFRRALAGASVGQLFFWVFFSSLIISALLPSHLLLQWKEGALSGKVLSQPDSLVARGIFFSWLGAVVFLISVRAMFFLLAGGVCVLEDRFRFGVVDRRIDLRDGICPLASHLDGPEGLARAFGIILIYDGRRMVCTFRFCFF